MDPYVIALTIIGFAALGMAWMPSITAKTHVSYSIFYVLLGVLVYTFIRQLPDPLPLKRPTYTLHLTEMMVLLSLMGTGLKIDQPFSFKEWTVPFKLIVITMLLSIAAVTALGITALNFDVATALLLGAALAPTDPVLASDVQVGPPLEEQTNKVRFSLTAEAGMNDGMAFPFVWLAIVLAVAMQPAHNFDILNWIFFDLIYRIVAGALVGFILGKLVAWAVFDLPQKKSYLKTRDGFVAISTMLLVYGITEMVHGYGFIAVFVSAVTIRNYELHHKYHRSLHSFTDQVERIVLAIILVLFGGSLVRGILNDLTWEMALIGIAFVFIIRPLSAYLALINSPLHTKEKLAISFFGIRGIGSFYYLAFAIGAFNFPLSGELWSLVAFIVLISIILHGTTAVLAMTKIEEEFGQEVEIRVKE